MMVWDYMGYCGWLRKTCTRQGNYNYRQLWNAVNIFFFMGEAIYQMVQDFATIHCDGAMIRW
jgi:hypothetical protein